MSLMHSAPINPAPLNAQKHLRLALPYTVLTDKDSVRLVAGEDFRYTFRAPGLETWLPAFVQQFDGKRSLATLLSALPEGLREAAQQLAARLYSERILSEATAADAHPGGSYRLEVSGTGAVQASLGAAVAVHGREAQVLRVFCQDSLDYHAALKFNRQRLRGSEPWLWVTTGPLSRGYVSPVFLPRIGPCLECLIRHFQWLSPAPEIYTHLIAHAQEGKAVQPLPFPRVAAEMLSQVVLWKTSSLAEHEPPAALYRLHVLEVASLEISSHRVFADSDCPACREAHDEPLV